MDAERRVEYMDLDAIEVARRNPKAHAAEEIAASISHHGLAELPLLDERTTRLVAGHGRISDLRARRAAGQDPPAGVQVDADGRWLVPIDRGWASRSDEDAEAYLLASNQLTIRGGWDNSLSDVLRDLNAADPDLALLAGWPQDELDALIGDLDDSPEDDATPPPADPWPTISVTVPPHVAAAWRSHVDTHDGDDREAFAALLDVGLASPGASGWTP